VRISRKTEYALRAILDLSLQLPDDVVNVASIAAGQGIPPKLLGLILADLTKSLSETSSLAFSITGMENALPTMHSRRCGSKCLSPSRRC
jgi:hypothetical protein